MGEHVWLDEIRAAEEAVRRAQLSNDASALDLLIADRLQFVFLDGSVATKAQDLEAHRNKAVRFEKIEFSEQRIEGFGGVAVVTVRASLQGRAGGSPFEGTFRYCRTWMKLEDRWQIVAGCVTSISAIA